MAKVTLLTVISILVGFVAFVFSIVGLSTNDWLKQSSGSNGLWSTCNSGGDCKTLNIGSDISFKGYEMVRGFGVLSVALGFFGTFTALASLLIQKFKINHSVLASLFLIGSLFTLISAAVFTGLNHTAGAWYGYSFALTWTAFPLILTAGVISTYLALTTEDE